jgi:hypothetical protein
MLSALLFSPDFIAAPLSTLLDDKTKLTNIYLAVKVFFVVLKGFWRNFL